MKEQMRDHGQYELTVTLSECCVVYVEVWLKTVMFNEMINVMTLPSDKETTMWC